MLGKKIFKSVIAYFGTWPIIERGAMIGMLTHPDVQTNGWAMDDQKAICGKSIYTIIISIKANKSMIDACIKCILVHLASNNPHKDSGSGRVNAHRVMTLSLHHLDDCLNIYFLVYAGD